MLDGSYLLTLTSPHALVSHGMDIQLVDSDGFSVGSRKPPVNTRAIEYIAPFTPRMKIRSMHWGGKLSMQ